MSDNAAALPRSALSPDPSPASGRWDEVVPLSRLRERVAEGRERAPHSGEAVTQDWTVFDRPELRDLISVPRPDGAREALIGLDGMHCAGCVVRVEKLLDGLAADLRVSLTSRTAAFEWDPARLPLSRLLAALDRAGFTPRVLAQERDCLAQAAEGRAARARIGVAALCTMQVMMLAVARYFAGGSMEPAIAALMRYTEWLLATPVVLYAGAPFFRGAFRALAARAPNMDVPVALAVAIAYFASAWRTASGHGEIYFDSASMFVLFLSAGRYLESRTRAQASERLRTLAGRQPLTARRVGPDGDTEIPLTAVAASDVLRVPPGEAVPVDGALLDAAAELDESLLTGESQPVPKMRSARLLAGSLNVGARPLTVRAEGIGADTTLSQITRLLHRAQSERPRFQVLADRLAGHFIVAVLALAAFGAWLWRAHGFDQSLSVALAVMVASCPCALSLAVPATLAAAASRLAACGALVARPDALARLSHVDTVLFDKTGTLTRGGFSIVRVHLLGGLDEMRCKRIAAALERGSAHPIAKAFAGIAPAGEVSDAEHLPGGAVTGRFDGQGYWIGAPERSPLPLGDQPARDDPTLTWVLLIGEEAPLALLRGPSLGRVPSGLPPLARGSPQYVPYALFGLAAAERSEAAAVIAELQRQGRRVELLTGDSRESALRLAARLGIAAVRERQSPQDKLDRLRALRREGHVVMAVGDGVNDAPLLAGADVAVSLPAGAALAQARADVILAGDSLSAIPRLFETARRATRLMRQNVGWALGYNLAVMPLAMAGWLAPWMAALGMSLSSLVVVSNALRAGAETPAANAAAPARPAEVR